MKYLMLCLFTTFFTHAAVDVNMKAVGKLASGTRTAFTPVFKNAAGTTCSNYTASGYYWRMPNDDVCMEIYSSWTGTCAAASSALYFSLPANLNVNTSKLAGGTNTGTTNASALGVGWWWDQGVGSKTLFAYYATATQLRMTDNPGLILDNTVANADQIKFNNLCVPVTGW